MIKVKSEFKEFYEKAVRCEELDRGISAYNPSWICNKNGLLCGPGNCPKQPWLRALMPKAEPKPEPEVENEIVEKSPELALERVKPVVSEPSSDQDSEKLVRKETGIRILARDAAKSKTRAHTKKSILKRATITFIEKKTKQLQRWGMDLIFSQKNRKTSVLSFRTGLGVRFYFGKGIEDENAKACVESWFESLAVHDSESFVNPSGSPKNFSVDIQET